MSKLRREMLSAKINKYNRLTNRGMTFTYQKGHGYTITLPSDDTRNKLDEYYDGVTLKGAMCIVDMAIDCHKELEGRVVKLAEDKLVKMTEGNTKFWSNQVDELRRELDAAVDTRPPKRSEDCRAYEVTKEILYKRRSPYEGINALALIMLETEFPIFMGDPNERDLEPGDYSDHDIHDAENRWPYNLVHSMPIEDFAVHITQAGEERFINSWVERICVVNRFVEPGNLFVAMGHTYMSTDGVRVEEFVNGVRVPFNYTTVDGNTEMVWSTDDKLKGFTNYLVETGRLAMATKSVTMDNELRLRELIFR